MSPSWQIARVTSKGVLSIRTSEKSQMAALKPACSSLQPVCWLAARLEGTRTLEQFAPPLYQVLVIDLMFARLQPPQPYGEINF
jgi:hypothetical protein